MKPPKPEGEQSEERLAASLAGVRRAYADLDARLVLTHPLEAPLRGLDAKELDILQLALNFGHVATVLNKSPATDLETAQLLMKLIQQRYLQPE